MQKSSIFLHSSVLLEVSRHLLVNMMKIPKLKTHLWVFFNASRKFTFFLQCNYLNDSGFGSPDAPRFRAITLQSRDKLPMRTMHQKPEWAITDVFYGVSSRINDSEKKPDGFSKRSLGCVNRPIARHFYMHIQVEWTRLIRTWPWKDQRHLSALL